MLVAAGRWLVIAVAVASIAIDAVMLAGIGAPGYLGVDVATLPDGAYRVTRVVPGSSAAAAGLVPGDVFRGATASDAAAFLAHVRGSTIALQRIGKTGVTVELRKTPLPAARIADLLLALFYPCFAILIALRSWNDPQARRLSVAFLTIVPYIASTLQWRSLQLGEAFVFFAIAAVAWGLAALCYLSVGYAATPDRARTIVRRLGTTAAFVFTAFGLANLTFLIVTGAERPAVYSAEIFAWLAGFCTVIAGLLISLLRARGLERRRISWVVLAIAFGIAPLGALVTARAMFPGLDWPWVTYVRLFAPFGLAYATLRHRVVDLGFALNRAAVFGATTASLVGLFSAMQWAVDHVLAEMTRAQGFAVQLGIAIVVFYIVRIARSRTEVAIARLFFGNRRRRVEAIEEVAHDLDSIEDEAVLAPFVVNRLRGDVALESSLYVESDANYVRVAGETGPALIARGIPVAGAIAFPLAARNRSRGALVCALPPGDDEFAPQERDALAGLAMRIAIARDDLSAAALRRELLDLRCENELLRAEVHPATATARSGAE